MLDLGPQRMVERDPCDLCGATACHVIAPAAELHHETAVCGGCGLVRAVGVAGAFDVDRFYEDEFTGDAGGNAIAKAGVIQPRQLWRQEQRAQHSLDVIRERVSLDGKAVLDVRCRSGALAALMNDAGARVTAVDFLEINVAHTRGRSSDIVARLLSVDDIENLPFLDADSVDVVTGLTVHVLGHLARPSRFLAAVARVLKPGGLLILDEKDIMECERLTADTILQTGKAHLFHLDPRTMAAYLQGAGLVVEQCADDPTRRSSFRHITAVARKPDAPASSATPIGDVEAVLAALSRSQRTLTRRRRLNKVRRSVRQFVKVFTRRRPARSR